MGEGLGVGVLFKEMGLILGVTVTVGVVVVPEEVAVGVGVISV